MSNKITTLGYFKKRLTDSGYAYQDVFRKYSYNDPRVWTIVIDPGVASVFCTCYVNFNNRDDSFFELYDGGQFIPGRLKIITASTEVVLEKLNQLDIINKKDVPAS